VVPSERKKRVGTSSLSLQFCCVLGVVFEFTVLLLFSLVLFLHSVRGVLTFSHFRFVYGAHNKCSPAVHFRAYLMSLIPITQVVPYNLPTHLLVKFTDPKM